MARLITVSALNTHPDGVLVGISTAEKVGFHGATPVAQRAGAAQTAVATDALAVGAAYSQAEVTAVATRATALTVAVNEIRATLVEKGLYKGAA